MEAFFKYIFHEIKMRMSFFGGFFFLMFIGLFLITLDYQELGLIIILSVLFTYLLGAAIRTIYFKERPDPIPYETKWGKIKSASFPSMHVARSSLVTTLIILYFQDIFVTMLFVNITALVCINRYIKRRHDFVDIVSGFILGIILALYLTTTFNF